MENSLGYYDITGSLEIPGQGFDYMSDPAFALGGITGLILDLPAGFRAAYSYQLPLTLRLDGEMQIGTGDYRSQFSVDVSSRFRLPERHIAALAWVGGRWKLGMDFGLIRFGSTLQTWKRILAYPWFPTPVGETNQVVGNLHIKDSLYGAIGGEYKAGDNLFLRAGYSHSPSPIGGSGISPLSTGSIHEDTYHLGFGFNTDSGLLVEFSWSYVAYNSVAGNDLSDWDLSHALYTIQSREDLNRDHVSMAFFKHRSGLVVNAPSFSVTFAY
jgi:long-chain fatty acid transport protein